MEKDEGQMQLQVSLLHIEVAHPATRAASMAVQDQSLIQAFSFEVFPRGAAAPSDTSEVNLLMVNTSLGDYTTSCCRCLFVSYHVDSCT